MGYSKAVVAELREPVIAVLKANNGKFCSTQDIAKACGLVSGRHIETQWVYGTLEELEGDLIAYGERWGKHKFWRITEE